jgi:altronate dehydratase large subunit
MNLPDHFAGFTRSIGRPGIRNNLLIVSVCGLNAAGARKVKTALPESILISTPYGRGQVGRDKLFHDTTLSQLACHPNTGGVILLAPDKAMRQLYQSVIDARGRLCKGFSLQESSEDSEQLVHSAIAAGRELLTTLKEQQRQPCPTSSLALAIECGHSDASSGIVANPLSGDFADVLVAAGGSVVISETLEWTGTEASLYERCKSQQVAQKLKKLVTARHQIAKDAGQNIHIGNPAPQNHVGGITTLEEKSLGAIAKGGTTNIVGSLEQGESIPELSGLYLMDTPTLSPESITSMVASGAQVVIFTTGQGNPYGSAVAPTIKLTANPDTADRIPHQVDFDASEAFRGIKNRQSLVPDLARLMIKVCEGHAVACEKLDEGDESISRLSPSI